MFSLVIRCFGVQMPLHVRHFGKNSCACGQVNELDAANIELEDANTRLEALATSAERDRAALTEHLTSLQKECDTLKQQVGFCMLPALNGASGICAGRERKHSVMIFYILGTSFVCVLTCRLQTLQSPMKQLTGLDRISR
jgi:hypothetical protein